MKQMKYKYELEMKKREEAEAVLESTRREKVAPEQGEEFDLKQFDSGENILQLNIMEAVFYPDAMKRLGNYPNPRL